MNGVIPDPCFTAVVMQSIEVYDNARGILLTSNLTLA